LQLTDVFDLSIRTTRASVITEFVGGTNFGLRSGFRGIEPSGPIQLQIRQGRKLNDFLFVDGISLVVSKKVVDLWEDRSFRGWLKVPAAVLDRKRIPINDEYFGIMITGRAGPRDKTFANCIRFDPRTWDGTELFLLADTDCVLVTRSVVEAL